ncbi:MAG: 1,2-phenylacetyl-CoA epoxidase subunit PaaC [Actinomycetes bacterium]
MTSSAADPSAADPSAADPSAADRAAYALRLGDDALVASQRLSEWVASAPTLEEDVALANIALDLLGQARLLLGYAATLIGPGLDEDDLAYGRDERAFTNVLLVEIPGGDFATTIARQLVFSAYQHLLYHELAASIDPTLSGVAAKAVKEVSYHLDHARAWTLRLGDGTPASHRRMQQGVDSVWPYVAEMFVPDALTDRLAAAGLGVDPDALRPAWTATMAAVVGEATLELPTPRWTARDGRAGRHTEHLGHLVAEMTQLHRSHPGASW